MLHAEGWSTSQIAQALRKHESSILRHIKDYQKRLKLKHESGGSQSKLSEAQTQTLITHLEAHLYQHNWQIVAYVQETYGVSFTVPGMHKWLHRHGFSYKQPKGVPYRHNPEQQEAFIAQYAQLKEQLKPDEKILFMDSVHPTQATKLSHGWIKKGCNKTVKTSASRTCMNIVL